ncbi:hypothetical protein B0H63DRAFT_534451 [Podospora didyma]|uniref:Mitochondrial cardiolipin hydrolase n=1 Tax=Podospora didyma TaxID=330526 RepID=A0AAE0N313_9PEZI|nr:hypothetical protein B0H63DRAFT_534451 [Podospora didyma]
MHFPASILARAMLIVVSMGSVMAQEPDPVIGAPVFNDPAGSETAQYAIYQQLARIIDRVPSGSYIEMSWFEFGVKYTTDAASKPNIPARLVKAHQRGVNVRIILDNNDKDSGESNNDWPAYKTLAAELGTSDSASSYIALCPNLKGCIAKRKIYTDTYAYNHNKFLLASSIVLNSGAVVSNVVFQSSGNLGEWDATTSWNNAMTWSEAASFANYHRYFGDQRTYHASSTGNDDYYWVGDSANQFKTHFFPRKETDGNLNQASTDTIVSILNSVSCSYIGETDGLRHQTDIRVVMWSFSRLAVAEKLAALVRAGCWVDVVVTKDNMNDGVRNALRADNLGGKTMGLTECGVAWQGRNLRPHSKYMLIDGAYDDDQIPRVFTGSHNYAVSALRNADESLVRVRSAAVHEAYLRQNFYKVRDTCSGKISPAGGE